jgi:drug/metabolite transporter (DMT)-like permease
MLGVLFGLLSALSFGLTGATIRRGVMGISALQGLYITVFTALPLFALVSLAAGELFDWAAFSGRDYVLLAFGGVSQLLVGRYGNYRAIAALGANRSAPIVGSATLVSVTLAVVFTGEEVTALMGVGIALMMLGPGLVAPRRKQQQPVPAAAAAAPPSAAPQTVAPPSPQASIVTNPRWAEGYLFGGVAAFAWGIGPVFIRSAVADSGAGVLGGFITYIAAATVLSAVLLVPGQVSSLRLMNASGIRWFLVTSLASFSANLFRVIGLALAPVAVVIPLMRLSAVFTLFFNLMMNRKLESFERRVISGIFVSVAGAVVLVLARP